MAALSTMTKFASITVPDLLTDDQIGHNVRVMQNTPTTADILGRWPSRRAVLDDARAANPALELVAVHRWFQRGSIPGEYDAALIRGADRRGFGLHPQELVNARAKHPPAHGPASTPAQGPDRKSGAEDAA